MSRERRELLPTTPETQLFLRGSWLPNDIAQHIFIRYFHLKDILNLAVLSKTEKSFVEHLIWFLDNSKHFISEAFNFDTPSRIRMHFHQKALQHLNSGLNLSGFDFLPPIFLPPQVNTIIESDLEENFDQPDLPLSRTHLHNLIILRLQNPVFKNKYHLPGRFRDFRKQRWGQPNFLRVEMILIGDVDSLHSTAYQLNAYAVYFIYLSDPNYAAKIKQQLPDQDQNRINSHNEFILCYSAHAPLFIRIHQAANGYLTTDERFTLKNDLTIMLTYAANPFFVAQYLLDHWEDHITQLDLAQTLENIIIEVKNFKAFNDSFFCETIHYENKVNKLIENLAAKKLWLNEFKSIVEKLNSCHNKSDCLIAFTKAMNRDNLSINEKIGLFDLLSPHPELNRHRNPTFDRLFGIHNTTSWRNTWKTVRDHAKTKLFSEVNELDDKTKKLELLEKAKQAPLFKTHRNNSFFQGAFGRTQAVIDIENKMAEIHATNANQATL